MGSWTDSAIEVSRRLFAVPMAEHSVAVARRLNAPSSIPGGEKREVFIVKSLSREVMIW